MNKGKLVIFLLYFCLFSALPVHALSCSEKPVKVERYTIPSEELHGELTFDVYVPPCMDERIAGGYPVVYLLHGQDMGIEIWRKMKMSRIIRSTLNTEDIPLFLTVVPQEDQYLLSFSLSGFGEALIGELIPWIDSHYNTCTSRNCRSLGGLSRGALWAEKISFEHSDLFGAVGLLSMPGRFIDDQSFFYLVEKNRDKGLLRIRMDTGSEDSYRHDGRDAAAQLTYLGYPFEYNIQPGGHDTDYWKARLSEYFVWYSKSWNE